MKVLSLAVALLLDSSSAIQLHKSEKNLIDIKSELNIPVTTGPQSLTQASSKSGSRMQMRQQQISEFKSNIKSAQSIQNLSQAKALVKVAHDDLASIAVNALRDKASCADGSCEVNVPNLQNDVNEVSAQMPVLGALEKKLGLMKALNPELKSLSRDLQEVADWDDMKLAKLGGRAIHSILDHAYPTGGSHDFGMDVEQTPSVKGILTKPADPLLPTSGVVGLLKAARPSQKIPLSMFPSGLDEALEKQRTRLEGDGHLETDKLKSAVNDLKDKVENVSERKNARKDREELTAKVAAEASKAVEKVGDRAAIVAKSNPALAVSMLKIAKKTAREAAEKQMAESVNEA